MLTHHRPKLYGPRQLSLEFMIVDAGKAGEPDGGQATCNRVHWALSTSESNSRKRAMGRDQPE